MAWCNVLSISLRQITSRLSWTLCGVALVVCLFSCDTDKPDNLEPQITTLSATDITRTDATLNGSVVIEGETEMPQMCFRYGITEEMKQTATAGSSDNSHHRTHLCRHLLLCA